MKKLILALSLGIIIVAAYSFTSGKGDECPAEGKANPKKGKEAVLKPREKNVNKHKNRQSIPQIGDYDKSVTIQGMYDSKDDSLWNEDKAGAITGYVFRAYDNSMESCNCFTEDKTKYSTNLYLSPTPLDKNTRTADCIAIVIMPYSRTLNKDWTADYINDKLVGKKVTASGWLIYDITHSVSSIMTNSNGSHPDRRTVWGICPMTDLKVAE
jgi:hypothetical protein